MITKREWQKDPDGTVHLRNTVDVSNAIEQAKMYDELGAGNGKYGYMMGVIPEELYMFDPWLQEAKRYKREGNMAQYTNYLLKFFSINRAFAVNYKKCMWHGYAVPIITKETAEKKNDTLDTLLDSI